MQHYTKTTSNYTVFGQIEEDPYYVLSSLNADLPFSVGCIPKNAHIPTDMSREARTVTTAANAKPHLDFTISILPEIMNGNV